MSTPKFAGITFHTAGKTFVVRGFDVAPVLRRAGMKPIFMASARGWMLDERHLADACAVLEWWGYRIHVRERGDAA